MRNFKKQAVAVAAIVSGLMVAGTAGATAGAMIGSEDIRNQSIKSWDISKNGVGFSEIRNGSVGWYNELNGFTRNKIVDIAKEHAGQDGEPGPAGADGADGADGVSGYEVVGVEVTVPADAQNFVRTQECPEGKVSTGGGFKVSNGAGNVIVEHSMPAGLTQNAAGDWVSNGWTVQVDNENSRAAQVIAYANCVSVN